MLLVLLVNAVEAMPRGGRLRISTEWEAATSKVRVRVLDNGVGIPPDVLPHIFEPFFTTKEDQHQTGLGLAVARNIVEQHGGTLTVRSAPGRGHGVHPDPGDRNACRRRPADYGDCA